MVAAPPHRRDSRAVADFRIVIVPGIEGSTSWPQVRFFVDGVDLFVDGVRGDDEWLGLDPDQMLRPDGVLHPVEGGRRVMLIKCSCGEIGCGAVSVDIRSSGGGDRVRWSAGRGEGGSSDIVVVRDDDELEGRSAPPAHLVDVEFDRQQYLDELERATRDRSWESASRETARLLADRLRPLDILIEPDYRFQWCAPNDRLGGVTVSFASPTIRPFGQRMCMVDSALTVPVDRADDMLERLLAVDPQRWSDEFPWSF